MMIIKVVCMVVVFLIFLFPFVAPVMVTHAQSINEAEKAPEAVGPVKEVPAVPQKETPPHDWKNRIDISVGYEYLTDMYGNWKSGHISYWRKGDDFTFFVQSDGFTRKEGNAVLLVGGLYKDWTPWLYTYSAIASGTNSEYLPLFRIDHDFNIKTGAKKDWVWTLGGTYIHYYKRSTRETIETTGPGGGVAYTVLRESKYYKDMVFAGGIGKYFDKWYLGYRLSYNISIPGNIDSFGHTFAAEYGTEGNFVSNLTVTYGNPSYLATDLIEPESVRQNAFGTHLKHRHWIGKDYGVIGEASFFNLNGGYLKYGFSLGIFKEF